MGQDWRKRWDEEVSKYLYSPPSITHPSLSIKFTHKFGLYFNWTVSASSSFLIFQNLPLLYSTIYALQRACRELFARGNCVQERLHKAQSALTLHKAPWTAVHLSVFSCWHICLQRRMIAVHRDRSVNRVPCINIRFNQSINIYFEG